MIAYVNKALSWVFVSKLRNSFVSKAFMAFSMTSMVLANTPESIEFIAGGLVTYRLVFTGSALFFLGFIWFGFSAPREFKNPGEIYEHVSHMQTYKSESFRKERHFLAISLLKSMSTVWISPPGGLIQTLATLTGTLSVDGKFTEEDAAYLYGVDLELRSYRSPIQRLIVSLLLLLGIVLMGSPTLWNAGRVVFFT